MGPSTSPVIYPFDDIIWNRKRVREYKKEKEKARRRGEEKRKRRKEIRDARACVRKMKLKTRGEYLIDRFTRAILEYQNHH